MQPSQKNHVLEMRRLLETYDRPGPRYTSYPTAVQFHSNLPQGTYKAHLHKANQIDAPWSIYTHLPFCQKRCLFCACNTIISPRREPVLSYLDELRQEIELVAQQIPQRRTISQFHWGGGTPTYFSPSELRALMDHFKSHFTFTENAEISVEIDPRVTTDEHLVAFAEMGFTRVSLGVQDIDPDVQKTIHRIQPLEETRHQLQRARELGIPSVNVDLIYGLPHQTPQSYQETVNQILDLSPDRLAIYSFAYVPWLKGHQKKLDPATLPDRHTRFELQAIAHSTLIDAGYVDIGMDHFARPDDELAIAQRNRTLGRNFMGYTTTRAPDMLGFGISSIGYIQGAYFQNQRKLSLYRQNINAQTFPVERGVVLNEEDLLRATVIREMMCNFHIDKKAIEERFDIDFDLHFKQALQNLQQEEQEGLIQLTPNALQATPKGQLFVRNLAMAFDTYLPPTLQRQRPTYSRTV